MKYLALIAVGAAGMLATAAAAQVSISSTPPSGPGDGVATGALVTASTNQNNALAVSGNTGKQSPVPVQAGAATGTNSALRNQPNVTLGVYGSSTTNSKGGVNGATAAVAPSAAGTGTYQAATVTPR